MHRDLRLSDGAIDSAARKILALPNKGAATIAQMRSNYWKTDGVIRQNDLRIIAAYNRLSRGRHAIP